MNNEPKSLTLPALDPADLPVRSGAPYPSPFDVICEGRDKRALGNALGLTNFGVNLVTLKPGAASAQRHWHSHQDEFVYVIDGDITLVSDAGEQVLGKGIIAGFPAGVADGHHLVNRGAADASYLEIGDRTEGDDCSYPDIDLALRVIDGKHVFVSKDGTRL